MMRCAEPKLWPRIPYPHSGRSGRFDALKTAYVIWHIAAIVSAGPWTGGEKYRKDVRQPYISGNSF